MLKLGIIGGSGLDNPDILKDVKESEHETLFGTSFIKHQGRNNKWC